MCAECHAAFLQGRFCRDEGNWALKFFTYTKPAVRGDQHLIVLDATADPRMLRHVFGRSFDVIDLSAGVDENFDITFLRHPATIASLTSASSKELWERISSEHGDTEGANGLLVAAKSVLEDLPDNIFPGFERRHFGGLRGLNSMSKFNQAVIVGQSMPGFRDIEMMAAAFAFTFEGRAIEPYPDDLPQLAPMNETGHYFHNCPTVMAFMENMAVHELHQAAGRLRAINKATRAKVTIVTNFLQPWTAPYVRRRLVLSSRSMPWIVVHIVNQILDRDVAIIGKDAFRGGGHSDNAIKLAMRREQIGPDLLKLENEPWPCPDVLKSIENNALDPHPLRTEKGVARIIYIYRSDPFFENSKTAAFTVGELSLGRRGRRPMFLALGQLTREQIASRLDISPSDVTVTGYLSRAPAPLLDFNADAVWPEHKPIGSGLTERQFEYALARAERADLESAERTYRYLKSESQDLSPWLWKWGDYFELPEHQ